MFGVPDFISRPARWKLHPMLRVFESAIDLIVSARRERIVCDPDSAPRDTLTFLFEAADPESGEGLSQAEIRANRLTFITAGHETTANCISWSLFLLSQSPE
jgi:cytochrome P450